MKTTSVRSLLDAVNLAIHNTASSEEVQKQMSAYGFTSKRMQEGKVKMERVRLMDDTQSQHYSHIRQMVYQFDQDSDAMMDMFKVHASIARTVFRKEKQVLQALKINNISSNKWTSTQQAVHFYAKAPMYMDRLKPFGATEESFAQNKAAAEALVALKTQRIQKKGDAENSTQAKDEAVKELRAWYSEFRKLARIALSENLQLLEMFGIVVPSSPKRKRKKAKSTTSSAK